ncbi:MAG: protein kinase [Myxococcota bacterium]|nr:protein kinase [Myxococcota bacterium]
MRWLHTTRAPDGADEGRGGASMVAHDFIGQTLVNRYVVDRVISQDALSATFVGTDSEDGRSVRIQILDSSHDPNGPQATALLEEIDTLQSIEHPNLVVPTDVRLHAGQNICVITDYPDAESLAHRLDAESVLAPRVAMRVMREILQGLDCLHGKELLSLNCSPRNVLLISDKNGLERAALSTLGLRHVLGLEHAKSRDPKGCYSPPEYVSPEAVSGRAFTEQTDQYLAGLVLYEMLAGRPAFSGDTFRKTARRHAIERPLSPRIVQRKANIPKAVDKLVMRCLEKTPNRRYDRLQEIVEELEVIASDDDNFRARTSLNFGASSRAPLAAQTPDLSAETDVEKASTSEDAATTAMAEAPPSEATNEQTAATPANESDGDRENDTTQPLDTPDETDQTADHAPVDDAQDAEGIQGEDDNEAKGARDTMDVSRFVADMENASDGVTVTDEPSPVADPTNIVMTDPKLRAMTQPLVSTSTRTQTNTDTPAPSESTPVESSESIPAEDHHRREESGHEERSPVTSRPFKETGQWFVESVEELQAQQALDQFDDFSATSDRNLFPYVVGIIAVVVFGLLAFWPESEPGLREKMNQTSVSSATGDNAKQAQQKEAAAEESAAQKAAQKLADEKADEARKVKIAGLVEQAERAAEAQNWMGTPDAFAETISALNASDEGRKLAKSMIRTQGARLIKEGTAALDKNDLKLAMARADLVLKLDPPSSVAQALKSTVTARLAAAASTTVKANEGRATAEKAAAEKAAAEKAAAEKAAAEKAAAEKAAAEKAAAEKAAAEKAAAEKAVAAKEAAAAKAAAAKKAAAKKAAAAKKVTTAKAPAPKPKAPKAVKPKPAPKKVVASKSKPVPPKPAGPTMKEVLKNGRTQLTAGRFDQAAKMFKAALRKNSKSAAAHAGLGRVAFQRKQFSQMAKHYKKSTRFAPRNAEYHVQLGLARFKLKKYADAKVSLTKALSIKPNHGKAKKYLRVVEKRLK